MTPSTDVAGDFQRTPGGQGRAPGVDAKLDPACYPVLLQLESGRGCLPAIKLVAPPDQSQLFPLSLTRLGEVWKTPDEVWPWVEKKAERNWAAAESLFTRIVDFPPFFLSAVMRVLRRGRFDTGEQVTNKNWNTIKDRGHSKINVDFSCSRCEACRRIPFPTLFEVHPLPPEACCFQWGLECALQIPRAEGSVRGDEVALDSDDGVGKAPWRGQPAVPVCRPTWPSAPPNFERPNPWSSAIHPQLSTQEPQRATMSQSLAALRIRENLGECSEPSQYAVGAEATVLLATPPTNAEIQEGNATEGSPQWARLVMRLMGWTSQHTVASFTGTDSASSF